MEILRPSSWTCLLEVSAVIDGDTVRGLLRFEAAVDIGYGRVQRIVLEEPREDVRLYGPEGRYFDTAEMRGRYARPEGERARLALVEWIQRATEVGRRPLRVHTFLPDQVHHFDGRDDFGRYLGWIEPPPGCADWTRLAVDSGLAVYDGRFPRPT